MDYAKVLRENLKDIMKQKGYTQSYLAEVTEITEATVSRYLTGVHSPKIEYIAKMAEALGVSLDYLFGLSASSIPDAPPSPEIRTLIAAYRRADAHTKKMVWMQLDLFLSDEEKESVMQKLSKQNPESKTETA